MKRETLVSNTQRWMVENEMDHIEERYIWGAVYIIADGGETVRLLEDGFPNPRDVYYIAFVFKLMVARFKKIAKETGDSS